MATHDRWVRSSLFLAVSSAVTLTSLSTLVETSGVSAPVHPISFGHQYSLVILLKRFVGKFPSLSHQVGKPSVALIGLTQICDLSYTASQSKGLTEGVSGISDLIVTGEFLFPPNSNKYTTNKSKSQLKSSTK